MGKSSRPAIYLFTTLFFILQPAAGTCFRFAASDFLPLPLSLIRQISCLFWSIPIARGANMNKNNSFALWRADFFVAFDAWRLTV